MKRYMTNYQLPIPNSQHRTASRFLRVGRWKLGVVVAALAASVLAAQQPPPSQQPAPQQPSEIGVRITGDPGVPPRYAVPDFVALTPSSAETAKMLGQVLWDDLNFEREFYMIPRDTAATVPAARTADQVAFASWRELGADAVFFGTVEQKGNDVVVQMRLFDVKTRQSVFSQEYTTAARSARRIAHEIADAVHLQQAALRGVARTQLTFVSDRNNESVLGTVEKRSVKEVYVADYDGANQRRITTTRQLNGFPSWSSDARAIAYMAWRNSGVPEIFVSFIYTGVLQNLTKGRFPSGGASLPVFSPDGKRIVFHATAPGASAPDLYVMDVDGSNMRRITTHPDSDTTPTWSPSGTQIAFTSDRTGKPQIYIMNADGSNVRRLPIPDGEADRATWAPAPYNEIAYSARTGAGYDIKVHELTTGQTRQLTFGEGTNESPSYSASGRHIAFSSTRRGNVHIFTMARDGNDVRQITRTGNNQAPDWSN
jgi:TolB protein